MLRCNFVTFMSSYISLTFLIALPYEVLPKSRGSFACRSCSVAVIKLSFLRFAALAYRTSVLPVAILRHASVNRSNAQRAY